MAQAADYELIDVGEGRRLERFGAIITDRPFPASEGSPRDDPATWQRAAVRYGAEGAQPPGWSSAGPIPGPWPIRVDDLLMELRLADSGQLGFFPEQIAIWRWVRAQIERQMATAAEGAEAHESSSPARPPRVLNLFAYTGGATLTAAAAGTRVVHVDGAKSAVAWARDNAELSALAGARIRWIVDDAATFASRELRRAPGYDGILLDPPSYGHGPGGRTFRLADDLPELLETCEALLDVESGFIALTAHTPAFGPDRLAESLRAALSHRVSSPDVEADDLALTTTYGRRVSFGAVAKWSR